MGIPADTIWQAKKKSTTATLYASGKLVIQGPHASQLASWLSKKGFVLLPRGSDIPERIGTDEAGKGDYFGPLVTAAVLVRPPIEQRLISVGVRDSKDLSDPTVRELARLIKTECPHAMVQIGPKRYNELHDKLRSVNRVLGWAHARAIEDILQKNSCTTAVSDQFGDEKYIKNSLLKLGRSINLIQMHHAERDIAVAGASILARDRFLEWLDATGQRYSFEFPKGASKEVIGIAKNFVRKFGASKLGEVAKLHFKTTTEVLGSPGVLA